MAPLDERRSCSRRAALRAGAIAVGGVLSGCLSAVPSSSESTVTDVQRAEGVSVRWQASLDRRIPVPAVDTESVYAVSSASGIHAFRTTDGTRRWHHSFPKSAWFGPRVGSGLIVAVDFETLVAFDAETGTEQWRHTWPPEGTMSSMPVIGEETLYVGNSSLPTSHTESKYPEDLFAFDLTDGDLRWKRDLAEQDSLTGTPLLHDGTLYVQTERSGLFALDPADGGERWQTSPGETHDRAIGGPTLVDQTDTLVASVGRSVYGLGVADGREQWRVDGTRTASVRDGTTVYAAGPLEDGATTLYALAASDGSEQWAVTRPGHLTRWGSLSAAGGTLFASFREPTGKGDVVDDISTLYGFSTEGEERWQFTRSCEGFSEVAVASDTVFVGSRYGDGTLYALDPAE